MLVAVVVFLVLIVCAIICLVENEHEILAFFLIVGSVVASLIKVGLGFGTVWTFVCTNPGALMLYFIAYVVIGVFWSMSKLYFTVYEDAQKPYFNLHISEYAGSIASWITYWPTSMLWMLISNPFTRLSKWLYETLKDVYLNIAKSAATKSQWKSKQ